MSAEAPGKNSRHEKKDLLLYLICAVLVVAILGLDLKVPLGVAVVILYNAVILLALRSHSRKFILLITIVSTVFTVCPLFHKAPVDEMWKAVSNRVLALFTMWVGCYLGLQLEKIHETRERALHEREKALEEVRVLRGFLPICASCKKIRSMEGSWTLLEKYISEHSEAEFSHGLCPDCTRKLFPDLYDKPHKERSDK